MSQRESNQINALYALWGLLAPLTVLAWFGVRALWTGHTQHELAPARADVLAASADAAPAPPPEAWQIHCYMSSAEPSGFAPVEQFAPSALPALRVTDERVPYPALLASSATSVDPFELHPERDP